MPSRRTILSAIGAGTLTLLLPRKSGAALFGTSSETTLGLPQERQVRNVLEVFLYGGLSPWETLYYVPDRGRNDKRFYYAFEGTENGPALTACGIRDLPTQLFARDQQGVDVHFGPFARALFGRPDLIDRMRVVVQSHNLLPHEAAVPYGITGKFVGSPALSSLGAHVQRAFLERRQRDVPYAYVLTSAGAIAPDNLEAFSAIGSHPGTARPLRLNLNDSARLETLLARPSVDAAHRAAYDRYVDALVRGFNARLRHRNQGEPLRSKATRELAATTRATAVTDGIAKLLPQQLLVAPETNLSDASGPNYPASGLQIATHLLKHPDTPAAYVCVVDSGLVAASGGGGYDTHATSEQIVQLTNLENVLTSLGKVINGPGEQDSKKLDLDQTLIILNTEFGRTPELQPDSGGRNHHPSGYVTAFLGGPVRGRSIQGAIDDNGVGMDAVTPAENRIAALLALGIHPFSPDAFSLSEVRGAGSESQAIDRAIARVLGLSSSGGE